LKWQASMSNGKPVHTAVIHAAAPEEAETLKKMVMDRFDCIDSYVTDLSPAIATHAGPGTVGIALCP
jgi:fatty acid-binding protein DegV